MSGNRAVDSTDLDEVPHSRNNHPQKGVSPWVKFGLPVALVVIIGAVLGGVLGTQLNKGSSKASNNANPSSSSSSFYGATGAASSIGAAGIGLGRFATGTDSFGLPIYPSTTNPAIFGSPTFVSQSPSAAWPTDTFKPSNPAPTNVRADRPRLLAPKYKWNACACAFSGGVRLP